MATVSDLHLSDKLTSGYELQEILGKGGFGVVYKAIQKVIDREVAIKIILPEYANKPEFIRRFQTEAKTVAKLDNRHIVSLYDFWRDPTGAYLVLRFLRGGTLSNHLEEHGALAPPVAARMLLQIADALSAAHRSGVIHRDVKPANILLDDEDNAYLSDFGIATDTFSKKTEESQMAMAGSAPYMAPEQFQYGKASPQSDIYSVTIMLYEILTGQHPFADAPHAFALMTKHIQEPLPRLTDFPKEINEILQKGSAKKPEERYNDIVELAVDFREAVKNTGITQGRARSNFMHNIETDSRLNEIRPEHVVNPYKGLQAFQENDAEDFYGREKLRMDILDKMAENHPLARFIAVIGPSGSGKSSVVKAGVIPELRSGELPGSDDWYYVEMVPGINPMVELTDALTRVSSKRVDNLLNRLMQSTTALDEVVKEIVPFDSELVLVIDQFEEAFTVGDENVRSHFLQNLYEAIIAEDSRLRVITTLRADFYDRPLSEARFGQLMEQRTIVVLPLTREELEETISKPAQNVGIYYQEGLAAQIVNDVINQPGILPMLQYALTELFKRRDGVHLTREAYEAIGGVLGALARRADELYQDLGAEEQEEARQLFLRLVTLGEGSEDTRRRTKQSEIIEVANNRVLMEDVIHAFSGQRLLTTDNDPATREPTVEVAHEALIREWKQLRIWLDDARNDLRLQRLLSTEAQGWENEGRDAGFLLPPGRLVQFEDWVSKTTVAVSPHDLEYVAASIQARDAAIEEENRRAAEEREREKRAANRLRIAFGVALVFLVFAILLAILAVGASRNALSNAARASTQEAVAVENAGDASTQRAEAEGNLVTAEFAGTIAADEANNASTQQALAEGARGEAETNLEQANSLATEAAVNLVDAQIAGTAAADEANNASTQQAIAEVAREEAEAAQAEAIANAQASRSLALSGSASDLLTRNSPLSLLLAMESNNILDESTAISLRVLSQSVFASPRMRLVTDLREPVTALTFVPNTQVMAINIENPIPETLQAISGTVDGRLYLWNVRDNTYQAFDDTHIGSVNGLAISPLDNNMLVSVGNDGQAKIWNIATRQSTGAFTLNPDIAAQTVAFNPLGNLIAVGYADGNIGLFDANGNLVSEIPQVSANAVNSLVFRPLLSDDTNTNDLAIAFDDAVRYWDASSNLYIPFDLGDIFSRLDSVQAVVFDANNSGLVLTSESDFGNRPQLWTLDVDNTTITDNNIQPSRLAYPEHLGQVTHVTYNPNGEFIVSSAADGSVFLTDADSGQLSRRLAAHSASVAQAAFTSDGRFILTGGADGALYLWDFNTTIGQEDTYNSGTSNDVITNTVSQVRFTEDERIFAGSERGEVGIWDFDNFAPIFGVAGQPLLDTLVPKVVYHLIEKPIVEGSPAVLLMGSTDMQLYDIETGEQLAFYDHERATAFVYDLAITRDGQWAVWAGGYFERIEDREALARDVRIPILHLWHTETGEVREFDVNARQAALDVTTTLVPTTPSAQATVQTTASATTEVATDQLVDNTITAVAIHPNDAIMVTGDEFGILTVWDIATGRILYEIEEHTDIITVLEFNVDGTQLLSGSEDRIIILWTVDPATFLLRSSQRFIGHTDLINDVDFNPINNTIVSGSEDRRFILWDALTGEILQILGEQPTAITTIQFTPDGEGVVFGTLDGHVLFKGISTAEEIIEWAGYNRYVPCLNTTQAELYEMPDYECDSGTG